MLLITQYWIIKLVFFKLIFMLMYVYNDATYFSSLKAIKHFYEVKINWVHIKYILMYIYNVLIYCVSNLIASLFRDNVVQTEIFNEAAVIQIVCGCVPWGCRSCKGTLCYWYLSWTGRMDKVSSFNMKMVCV